MYNIWLSRKQLQGIPKGEKTNKQTIIKKTQFEATEQVSEADMVVMLELSTQGLKTSMMNMLSALIDKVDST